MDIHAQLVETLKRTINPEKPVILLVGTVTAVNNDYCTVVVDDLDDELTDVRLMPIIQEEQGDRLLVTPKVDSYVLLGSLTGDLTDLAVLKVTEVEKVVYEQNGLHIEIDSTDGKISIENETVSLKSLFSDLYTLLKTLKVNTPAGPSGALMPDSMQRLSTWKSNFEKMIK